MAEAVPSCSVREENIVCVNCHVGYGEFWAIYSGKFDKLIELAQNHGVLLKERECPTCKNLCRLDLNRKQWRCDKSYVAGKRRRKRCSFSVSVFKGTWFANSHLDIETKVIVFLV